MAMRLAILITLAVFLPSCAALRIEPHDSFLAKTAKVTMRVPLFVGTVGWSEIFYACYRGPNPQACVDRNAAQLDRQMMQAQINVENLQRAERENQRRLEEERRRTVHCESRTFGNRTYTECR